jgi:hypothetical protein
MAGDDGWGECLGMMDEEDGWEGWLGRIVEEDV